MPFTKFIIFIITVIIVNIYSQDNKTHHYTYLAQILKYKNNFFRNLHENAQKIINTMFDSLDLVEEFSKDPKIKLLLTMHYDLNNMAEKNFEMYDALRNASAIKVNKTAININHLDEIVKEISSYRRTTVRAPEYVTRKKIRRFKFNKTQRHKVVLPKKRKSRARVNVYKRFNTETSSESQETKDGDLKIWNPKPWTSLEEDMFNNVTAYRRIYGGKKTNIVSFPFIVSIQILNDFTCAGSIISKDLIITAASCLQIHYNNRFFRENPKTTFVRVGSDWVSRRGELVPVLEIYFHPMYDPKTLNHNIAIVRLTRSLNLGTGRKKSKIRRILLDRGDGNLPSNTNQMKILGWGAQGANQVLNVFQKLTIAKLNIYGIDECKEIYSKTFVTENHFCAGYISRGTGACNRDVGGPGFTDNFLIGVISFGSPMCGAADSPTVFTRVGHYYDWIEDIMRTPLLRYGAPLTHTPANKLIIYFNTITTTKIPHMYPVSTRKVRPLLSEILRLRADDSQDNITSTTVPNKVADTDVVYAIEDGNDTTVQDKPQDYTYDDHEIINPEKELNVNVNVSHPSVINETNSFNTTTTPKITTMNIHVPTKHARFSTISTSALPYKNENLKPDVRRFDDTNMNGEFYETVVYDDGNITSDESKAYNDASVKPDFDETKVTDYAKVTTEFNQKNVFDNANVKPAFNDKNFFDDENVPSNSDGKYTYVNGNIEGDDDVYNANNFD